MRHTTTNPARTGKRPFDLSRRRPSRNIDHEPPDPPTEGALLALVRHADVHERAVREGLPVAPVVPPPPQARRVRSAHAVEKDGRLVVVVVWRLIEPIEGGARVALTGTKFGAARPGADRKRAA